MRRNLTHIMAILCMVFLANFLQAQAPEGYTWQDTSSVDFGAGANHFWIEAASAGSGGEVELRLDVSDGAPIGRIFFHHTGGSNHFMNYECDLEQTISGNHDVYMSFQDYTKPVKGGVLNIGDFQFSKVEEPAVPEGDSLHVYPLVSGLDPSPYYAFKVQKVSELNSSNLEEVTNWEEPFAFFTKCKDYDPEGNNLKYYSSYIGSWSHTYCNIELDWNTPIVVKITRKDDCAPAPSGAILSAAAHPAKKVEACQVINGEVYVTMSNPSQVSIDIDGQMDTRIAPRAIENSWNANAFPYRTEAKGVHSVSIFANPFIDKPDINDPGVVTVAPGTLPPEADGSWSTLYFLPGVHHFSMTPEGDVRDWKMEDLFRLRNNINIYIPGDAFIYGNFTDDNDWKLTENVRIYGHGTICGTHMNHAQYAHLLDPSYAGGEKHSRRLRMLHVTQAENVHFEGITVTDQPHHGCYIWGTNIDAPQNSMKWAKIIGWRVNSDGMHVSKNSIIEDCFLRSQDDGVYVSGAGIRRCVFWTDVNGIPLWCVVITGDRGGAINQNPLIVEDIDCIYGRGVFQTGAIINAFTAHEAKSYSDGVVNTGQHVYFRNINFEDPLPRRRLFAFSSREDQTSDWAGIRFENMTMQYPQVNGLKDQLMGSDKVSIRYFSFDNVKINGVKVNLDYINNPALVETKNIGNLTIRLTDTIPSTNYTLTRTAINGSVTIDTETPGKVTVTAVPIDGYEFDSWGGDLTGTENHQTITMDSEKVITANFEEIPVYALTTTAENGSIELTPEEGSYKEGTVVTVKAVPIAGFAFNGWSGDLSGNNNPTTIVMDSDKEISAEILEIIKYTLTTNAVNGSIQIIPENESYIPGEAAVLNATPDEGYTFEEWSGDLSGNDNPTSIIMDENKSITAEFTLISGSSQSLNHTADKTMLRQNYPNPFSISTTIPYQLNKAVHVKISVYNFLGEKLIILLDQDQQPGYYELDWDARGFKGNPLPDGVYFYRMEFDDQPEHTKMMLISR